MTIKILAKLDSNQNDLKTQDGLDNYKDDLNRNLVIIDASLDSINNNINTNVDIADKINTNLNKIKRTILVIWIGLIILMAEVIYIVVLSN